MPTYGMGRQFPFAPAGVMETISLSATGQPPLDADNEKLAFKHFPDSTSPITDVDLNVEVTGSLAGINFRMEVQSDSADAPSDSVLGQATPEFTIPADGFSGIQTLAANTGNLTLNVPVWIVLYRSSGNSLSGTNYLALRGVTGSGQTALHQTRHRHYNGTNWTTTAPTIQRVAYVLKHLDGSYVGLPHSSALAAPTVATDIYGAYRHGIRLKVGSQCKIPCIVLYPVKNGSPNALVVTVFEDSVSKYSATVPAASLVSTIPMPIWFASPTLLAANTNLYITLHQENEGGSDANDYDSRVTTFPSAYRSAIIPADWAFVYGSGGDPTALTVSDTEFPFMFPILVDPATDLDEAAGGGPVGNNFRGGFVNG